MPLGTVTVNLPFPSDVTSAQIGPVSVRKAAYTLLVGWYFGPVLRVTVEPDII